MQEKGRRTESTTGTKSHRYFFCFSALPDVGFLEILDTNILQLNIVFSLLDIVKENDNDIEFHAVFQRLSEEEIPDLPPGGGLYSKYVK